ncbi:MAG: hypothetical protein CME26_14950 [Gemmatimonadetes bacterium]|nr:hypothetical protein [Gemmatimonadota bacterium]|tara:strand:- start:22025 stop:23668 length:1644 start_codon:yes stop_codon:yes gene_type:complete
MNKPRLICYQDAHHYHAKRLDPPLSLHKLRWPVDELLGTGVDMLAFGLGYGDVYFHDSKVGRVVDQKKEVWTNLPDWRIMRMAKDAREMGTDQLKEVVNWGREMGLSVIPSLKIQSCDKPDSDRAGILKWDRHEEVCLGEIDEWHPRYEFCYDYAHPAVREAKLAVIGEVLEDYQADGIELDFMFVPRFFKKDEQEANAPIMDGFVSEVRKIADEVGKAQSREVTVAVRVFDQERYNLRHGLDVRAWLKQKSVDIVVGQITEFLFDTGVVDVQWLGDAANEADAAAYVRPSRRDRVYDERTARPSIEMYRALTQTIRDQGCAGLYLGNLPWPFGQREYQILREVAYPEAHTRSDKIYLLQPREPGLVFEELLDYASGYPVLPRQPEDEVTDGPPRQLPVPLEEGKTASIGIVVSDDLDSARQDGEMRKPELTIRFNSFCIDDKIEIRFNDRALSLDAAELTDERALAMADKPGKVTPIEAPMGMSAHWFRFMLDIDLLQRGTNTLEVEVKRFGELADFERSINGVEVRTRYKDFERPRGLEVSRIDP